MENFTCLTCCESEEGAQDWSKGKLSEEIRARKRKSDLACATVKN